MIRKNLGGVQEKRIRPQIMQMRQIKAFKIP